MTRGGFAYAEARIAARHGLRPDEGTWRRLEASASLAHLLETARLTSLRPWVARLHAGDGAHAIERSLRADFAAHALEVAAWVPEPWRAAVGWTHALVVLPFVGAWPDGAPDWTEHDRWLSGAARRDELEPLFDAARGRTPLERWSGEWRGRWPRTSRAERAGLEALGAALGDHRARMRTAPAESDGWTLRRTLEARVLALFRRHAEQPAQVFCHLTLTALDLERLRAALLGRALFSDAKGGVAWA